MTMIRSTRGRAAYRDEAKARGMVMDIDRRGEANGERTVLHPIRIIDTQTATMTRAAIATSAAPKRRNAEARRPKRRNAAGAIAIRRVVTTRPRRDGTIEIASTIPRRARSGRSKSKRTNLRSVETTKIVEWIENSTKKTRSGLLLHRYPNVFRRRKNGTNTKGYLPLIETSCFAINNKKKSFRTSIAFLTRFP